MQWSTWSAMDLWRDRALGSRDIGFFTFGTQSDDWEKRVSAVIGKFYIRK